VSVEPVDADLTRALRTVIDRCLAVEPGERVPVVVDPGTDDVAWRDDQRGVGFVL
jgi:hypothetical protein